MTGQIMALCRAMGADESREELLLPLVQAAQTALTARLREGVAPEDCGSAFPLAAAMTAMEGLDRSAGGGTVTSFTAGAVSIRTERGTDSGRLAQAERLMAPWLRETDFAFQGVRG